VSIDLSIYAASQIPISHAALHEALLKIRWHLVVMDGTKEVPPTNAPLKPDVAYEVYGVTNASLLGAVRAALAKKDHKALAKLYETGGLNSVYFSVDKITEPIDCSEIGADEEYAAELRAAKLEYAINGHGGDLQFALWNALGEMTGGLMDDPQSGKFTHRASTIRAATPPKRPKK
jgi:hypothetical protein